MRAEISPVRIRAAERGEHLGTDSRDISSMFGAVERRDTGSETGRIREQAEIKASGEEMGVIAEAMGTPPTPHTTNMDSGAGRTGR